jgi:predicted enzyme related to lactoylglutathione lyase
MTGDGEDHRVFPAFGVSYLHIPAPHPARPAAFYRAAFAWSIRDDEDSPPSRTAPAT